MRLFIGGRLVWVAGLVAMFTLVALSLPTVSAHAAPVTAGAGGDDLRSQLRTDLRTFLREHGAAEHVSAGSLSVKVPGRRSAINVSAGTTTFEGSVPVGRHSVWQIGSNTKAFTSGCFCNSRQSTACRSTTRSGGGCRSIRSGGTFRSDAY